MYMADARCNANKGAGQIFNQVIRPIRIGRNTIRSRFSTVSAMPRTTVLTFATDTHTDIL